MWIFKMLLIAVLLLNFAIITQGKQKDKILLECKGNKEEGNIASRTIILDLKKGYELNIHGETMGKIKKRHPIYEWSMTDLQIQFINLMMKKKLEKYTYQYNADTKLLRAIIKAKGAIPQILINQCIEK